MILEIENLNHLQNLRILNLDDNMIRTIEGLNGMPMLETLQVKRNRIGENGLSDLMGLLEIPSLSVLDIQDNRVDDEKFLEEILAKLPNLKVLYCQNNPAMKKFKNMKKMFISKLEKLSYLIDKPVFDDDRRYAVAWARGGMDEEREERKKIKKEKDETHKKNHKAFKDMI